MDFQVINEANEAIKKINELSFKIRLRANNSLITIRNFKSDNVFGFAPISFELINFSHVIEKKAEDLFELVYRALRIITEDLKMKKNLKLQEKYLKSHPNERESFLRFEKELFLKYKQEEENHQKELQTYMVKLLNLSHETLKICKNSKPIIISVKIESAYIGHHIELFSQMADDLSNFIHDIESMLLKIQSLCSSYIYEEV